MFFKIQQFYCFETALILLIKQFECMKTTHMYFFLKKNLFFDSDDMNESMTQKQIDLQPPPAWVVVGESVLIRPYNTSGLIEFVGPTHFQVSFQLLHDF